MENMEGVSIFFRNLQPQNRNTRTYEKDYHMPAGNLSTARAAGGRPVQPQNWERKATRW